MVTCTNVLCADVKYLHLVCSNHTVNMCVHQCLVKVVVVVLELLRMEEMGQNFRNIKIFL